MQENPMRLRKFSTKKNFKMFNYSVTSYENSYSIAI